MTITTTDPSGNTSTGTVSSGSIDRTAPVAPTVGILSPNPAQTGQTVTLSLSNVET